MSFVFHYISQERDNLNLVRLIFLFVCLQNTSLNNSSFNFVQFLQEIASEQQFEVTYVDIEEKSITGNSAGTSS
jgi:RISC-loading complex subunit TARBP2